MCTFFRRFPATSLAILISLWVPTSAQTSQGGSRSAAPPSESKSTKRAWFRCGQCPFGLDPDRDLVQWKTSFLSASIWFCSAVRRNRRNWRT